MRRRPGWKTLIVWLVIVACLGALIWVASPGRLLDKLREIAPRYVVLGFGATLVIFVLKGVRYFLLLGRRSGLRRTLGIAMVQSLVSQFVPMAAGDLGYVAMVRATGAGSLGYGLATLLLVRLVDLFVLWMMYMLSLIFLPLHLAAFRYPAIAIGVLLTVSVGVVAAVVFAVDRAAPRAERLLNWMGLMRWALMRTAWKELVEGARSLALAAKPGPLAIFLALSLSVWLAAAIWNWLMWLAVGVTLGPAEIVFLTSVSYILTVLPAAMGLGDMFIAGILVAFGVSTADAAAFSLCARALNTAYQFLSIPILLLVMRGRWRAPTEVAQGPETA